MKSYSCKKCQQSFKKQSHLDQHVEATHKVKQEVKHKVKK